MNSSKKRATVPGPPPSASVPAKAPTGGHTTKRKATTGGRTRVEAAPATLTPSRRSSRSSQSVPASAPPEESGAIRLRDAALELFGKDGFDGTSVRDLADRAGVTPGLVKHHFGSKEGLRKEVDRYVLASIKNTWSDLVRLAETTEITDHLSIRVEGFQALFQAKPHIGRYIRRTLIEQSSASNAFFDGLAEVSNAITDAVRRAGLVKPSSDPEAQILYALTCSLMPVMLSRHIERHLGVSLRSDAGAKRWAAIDYEVMTNGILLDPDDVQRPRRRRR